MKVVFKALVVFVAILLLDILFSTPLIFLVVGALGITLGLGMQYIYCVAVSIVMTALNYLVFKMAYNFYTKFANANIYELYNFFKKI